MRSLFLVGFPRSGAGVLARGLRPAGYDLGPDPPPPGSASAADASVARSLAAANEALLARAGSPVVLRHGWRWHAGLEVGVRLGAAPEDLARFVPLLGRRPFCLWDPRWVWTLPALGGLGGEAGRVCVFREPRGAARALAEAARRDPLWGQAAPPEEEWLRAWTTHHRRVLEHLAQQGDWLFLHRDHLHGARGGERIAAFAGAPFDGRHLRDELARAPLGEPAGGEADEVYGELCARAAWEPGRARPRSTSAVPVESVAAVVVVREGAQAAARATLDSLLGQRGVACEVLAVDQSAAGDFGHPGVRVLRDPSAGRGPAYRAALEATDAPWIAWAEAGTRARPERLARTLRAAREHDRIELWTSDLAVSPGAGLPLRTEDGAGDPPPGGWASTVLVRRGLLARIDARDFTPAELELLRAARAAGSAAHLPEALVEVPAELQRELGERVRQDAVLLALAAAPPVPEPELTVLLASHDRRDVILDCLEAFARQLLPPGTLEIVVVDDGSRDGSPERIEALVPALPLKLVRQANAGAAAARNAGLPHARGRYLLLVNDDTVPFPDTAARHLAAHRELDDPRAIVLGTFEQPAAELENALVRVLERTPLVFGYPLHEPGAVLGGEHLYTCNASLRTEALREAGGFDERFPCYGEDTELGLRLERAGYRVHYRPEARALHRHVPTFEGLRWRQRAVARAHVRLFAEHPGRTFAGLRDLTREAIGAFTRKVGPRIESLERAARSLAGVDLAALEQGGDGPARAAVGIAQSLEKLLGRLDAYWWRQGCDEGLGELSLSGFPELLARRPLTIGGGQGPCALVLADAAGHWWRAVEGWLATGPALPRLVVAEFLAGPRAQDPGPSLAALEARWRRRGPLPRFERTVVPVSDSPARLLGAATLWIPTGADPRELRELAARAGVQAFEPGAAPGAELDPSRPLLVGVLLDTSPAVSFADLLGACAPLVGRAEATLALLHGPQAAAHASLVRGVLELALAGEPGGPAVRTVPSTGDSLRAFAGRADWLLAGPDAALPADLRALERLGGAADLAAALAELDGRLGRIPFVLLEEPQHA